MIVRANDCNSEPHPVARFCAWIMFVALGTTFFYQLTTGYGLTDLPQRTTYPALFLKYAHQFPASEDDQPISPAPAKPAFTQVDLNAP